MITSIAFISTDVLAARGPLRLITSDAPPAPGLSTVWLGVVIAIAVLAAAGCAWGVWRLRRRLRKSDADIAFDQLCRGRRLSRIQRRVILDLAEFHPRRPHAVALVACPSALVAAAEAYIESKPRAAELRALETLLSGVVGGVGGGGEVAE